MGMLLDYFGLANEAGRVEQAARASIHENQTTVELSGSLKPWQAGDWLAKLYQRQVFCCFQRLTYQGW